MSSGSSGAWRPLWLWGPVGAYTALIFWLSSAPRAIPGMRYFPWADKPIHLVEFLLLGVLAARAFRWWAPGRGAAARAFAYCAAVAAADELFQRFIPYRVPSLVDALFDLSGAAFGIFLYIRLNSARTP